MPTIRQYLSLVKFSHTIFAMPFALFGLFLGFDQGMAKWDWRLLICVILCMVFARNAAMGFNRFIDRRFDAQNPRTAIREIPSGLITEKAALAFVIINCFLFITTTYFINTLCFYLSPIALLVILGYSLTKRFTALCHLILGLGLSLAPIGAYIAVANQFHVVPIIIGFSVFCWVSGFDIIYALQDEEFDKSQNLNSIPVLLGRNRALFLSRILHLFSFLSMHSVFFIAPFHIIYLIGTILFGSFLLYQHTLVKANDLSKINLAFFTMNGIASIVFASFAIFDLLYF